MLNSPTPSDSISVPKNSEILSANTPLSGHVERIMRQYLIELNGAEPHNLYDKILTEVEKPLLIVMLDHTNGNQTKMAKMLGISRGTLRKKLAHHCLG